MRDNQGKYKHEWSFMANDISFGDGTSDLNFCSLCDRWQVEGHNQGKPFSMSWDEFIQLYLNGKINAVEVLGDVEHARSQLSQEANRPAHPTVYLIPIGQVPATPAGELALGDKLLFNYGISARVIGLGRAGRFSLIECQYKDGRTRVFRKLSTTLMATPDRK